MTYASPDPLGLQLDPLEIHSGIPLNGRRTPLPVLPPLAGTPDEVLEQILLPALQKPPFCVAYSGGRDSSAVLARATQIARKHGLAEPIPVTHVFPHHPRTDETEWQELTVRHLRLQHWERIEITSELDLLGPLARDVLSRYGLYWPPNAHNLLPMARAASGGTLVTGNGGDELFSAWPWQRIARVRRLQARPKRSELRYVGLSLMPTSIRRIAFPFVSKFGLSWLRPSAARSLRRRYAEDAGFKTWDADIDWLIKSRYRELSTKIFHRLTDDAGATLLEPFSDPRFLRSTVELAGPGGFPSRDEAMHRLFGDVLAPEVVRRSTKAIFTEVNFGEASRVFAKDWDGSGVSHTIVSESALRDVWAAERPSIQSWMALQSAWLAHAGSRCGLAPATSSMASTAAPV